MELDVIRRWLRGEDVEGLPSKRSAPRLRGKGATMVIIDDPFVQGTDGTITKIDLGKISAGVRKTSGKYVISMDGADAVLHFGRHNGKALSFLAASEDRDYLEWMLKQDFPDDLVNVVNHVLKKVKK